MIFYLITLIKIKDGIQFHRSKNNVILCSGDETGFLSTKYFQKVLDIKKSVNTLFNFFDYLNFYLVFIFKLDIELDF